ncbi:MAG: HAD family phosphatase [Prevotella sp.]|nr:HAD family phosphatase [Prevotella sp.]
MNKITNIAFDLGGVVMALSHENAVMKFKELGLRDAQNHLDAFCQHGIFGDLESGKISPEEFCEELGRMIGRKLTLDECYDAWHAYVESVPQRNLDALLRLRADGYKVCLLSNTNPFMMQWAWSPEFDGAGHPIDYYFDRLYLSYECRVMKPSPEIFRMMLQGQQATAAETLFIDDSPKNCEVARQLGISTLCPHNNEDWTHRLLTHISESSKLL